MDIISGCVGGELGGLRLFADDAVLLASAVDVWNMQRKIKYTLQAFRSSYEGFFYWLNESDTIKMPTTNYAVALLMPRPLLSTSICLMDHGGLDRGP